MSVQNIVVADSFAVVRFLQQARADIQAGLWDLVDEEQILRLNDFQRGKMSADIQLVLDTLAAGATELRWEYRGPLDGENEESEYGIHLTIFMHTLPWPLYITVTDIQLNRLKRLFREVMSTVAIRDDYNVTVADAFQSVSGMAIDTVLTSDFTLSKTLLTAFDESVAIQLAYNTAA